MSDHEVFATTARLHLQARATPDELEAIALSRGIDPAVFQERAPFFWLNEISSDRLDAYYTTMDPATTLANFAREAGEGRAFLAGHNSRTLPFGYTLTGQLETQGDVTRVLADAYTLRDLELGGVRTNDFIDGARAGLIRDTSVGFFGGQFICSICGLDMRRDWDCWHIPGFEYEVKEPGSNIVRLVLCTATVVDAHLSEVSAVYDGATPGAAILQAQRQAEAGRIRPEQARLIEQRYRIRLPDRRLVVPGAAIPSFPVAAPEPAPLAAGDRASPNPQETPVPQETSTPAGERETPVQEPQAADLVPQLRSLFGLAEDVDLIAHLRQLAQELPQLRAQAADGRAYRAELEQEALAEAVRALGAEAEETYQSLLASLPVAAIRQMRDAWREIADAALPRGRRSVDSVPPAPSAVPADPGPPDDVYRA